MKKIILVFIMLFVFVTSSDGLSQTKSSKKSKFKSTKFTLNLQNSDIREFLKMVKSQTGLRYKLPRGLKTKVSYSFEDVTLETALKQITEENDLRYSINNGVIYISSSKGSAVAKSVSQSDFTPKTPTSKSARAHRINLRYLSPKDAQAKIQEALGNSTKLVIDTRTNSLVVIAKDPTVNKIKSFLDVLDVKPKQILIQAQIIEAKKSKVNELGLYLGDLTAPGEGTVSKASIFSNPQGGAGTAWLGLKSKIGWLDGRQLDARLAAAEDSGNAKIISKPKVITLNNETANITSGITYSVRTLAAVSTGEGAATGGIEKITAGLTLDVTPVIVDGDKILLKINVNSSEPDAVNGLDGIPNVSDNSAKTSIIVEDGQTATMAGLIKNSFDKVESGVPFLSSLPIIGWLFKHTKESKRDTELIIYITPKII